MLELLEAGFLEVRLGLLSGIVNAMGQTAKERLPGLVFLQMAAQIWMEAPEGR